MAPPKFTAYRSCNLCEAICGLVIEHDGSQVVSIKGDSDDPLSRGHICPKAIALQDIHTDPDRLRTPMKRTSSGFEPISWDAAFDLAEQKLTQIRNEHGNDAVALYLGNPTVHHSGAMLFQSFLKKALKTKNQFAATSVDQLPHHLAASLMFGHALRIPIPDIDRTQFMLILGANPAASNGSLMTAPDVKNRIKAIRKRGGKVFLLDPRKTESAKLVDQHFFINPATDVYLLAALLNRILTSSSLDLGSNAGFTKNIDQLRSAVAPFSLEIAAKKTGVTADTIAMLADEFAAAESAVVYGRMGVSTQANGSLCNWLMNAINLVTGNLDRAGGQMFATPAISIVGGSGTTDQFDRWKSRVRGLPEFEGDLPVSVLAEEITTAGDGQIRALITNAGNPVLSTPNGGTLDAAIESLDFYVAIDVYVNETTRHADLILPPPTSLEVNHYDLAFNALAVHDVAKYSPQIFKPAEGSKYDWQIMRELAVRLWPASDSMASTIARKWKLFWLKRMTPARLLDLGLRFGPYGGLANLRKLSFKKGLTLNRVKTQPHGVDLGDLKPMLPGGLRTSDRKIDAAPEVFVQGLQAVAKLDNELASAIPNDQTNQSFYLIGRRHLRSNNSWMHNSKRLVKGPNRCTLMLHSTDASSLGFEQDEIAVVQSSVGRVELPVEITDDIKQGVVSIPHGYGHHRKRSQLSVASQNAGVSINDLTDAKCVDPISGNAAFSGQRVTVTRKEV